MSFRLLLATLIAIAMLPTFTHAQNASGPAIGSKVDDVSLTDQTGKQQRLSDLLTEGPIAIVVVRSAGWCSLSKHQLVQLQGSLESIKEAGLNVVALSYDMPDVVKDFSALRGVQFPLFADPDSKVIEKLGVINTTRKEGTLRYRVAYPVTILVDTDRTVVGSIQGSNDEVHDADQLIDFWNSIKQNSPAPKEQKKENGIDFITVQGNKFVNESGDQVVFKGLAISDPDKIANDGHWDKKHFETIKSWGVTLIRIPVNPSRLRKRGLEEYLKLLDDAVRWCGELDMYVIIDWHSIGNLRTEKFESSYYKTTQKETLAFWDAVSKRFAGNPTVAFYEIFNEPSLNNGNYGKCTWKQWKTIAERIIDVIYANDRKVIPLVAGFNWAYDLRNVKAEPIARPGVAYVAHPYPGKCRPPRERHWEQHFGFLTARYPVIATEMGYALKCKDPNMVDKDGSYRNAILKYFDKKKISWCAWVFDPNWTPGLIKSYNYEPSHSGTFFRRAMQSK